MKIEEIYTDLANALSNIELYRKLSKDIMQQEYERLSERAKMASERGEEYPSFESVQAMYFYDAMTGTAVAYGHSELSAEDKLRLIETQKNRQYCWLLVEAYEEFEDYIERIYAYIGKRNADDWVLEDFGNIRLPDLREKDFQWHLETVKKKYSQNPKRLLNKLRSLYPNLRCVEEHNALGANLRVSVELIANLRHQIVHSRGQVESLEDFCKEVLEKCGLWNNGNPKMELMKFIEQYLREASDVYNITLIEIDFSPPGFPINVTRDVFGGLIGHLMAYALQVLRCVEGQDVVAQTQ